MCYFNMGTCFFLDPARPTVDSRRSLFQSYSEIDQQTDRETRKFFYEELKEELPESSFVMMTKAEFVEDSTSLFNDQLTSNDIESTCIEQPTIGQSNNTRDDQLTSKDIESIEQATIGQSNNDAWHSYRKGRITASNFYDVFTRVETLKKKGGSAQNLVEKLQGVNGPPPELSALKYGRNMEDIAKMKYIMQFQKEHKNASHRECGLFIYEKKQYIGASPDLLLHCSCCGNGVLEIKRPFSIANDIPSPGNLPYLIHDSGHIILKQKHKYYAQVQGQMAVAKRDWCHFLVYTNKGQHLERIEFNPAYWSALEKNLTWFYVNYLLNDGTA